MQWNRHYCTNCALESVLHIVLLWVLSIPLFFFLFSFFFICSFIFSFFSFFSFFLSYFFCFLSFSFIFISLFSFFCFIFSISLIFLFCTLLLLKTISLPLFCFVYLFGKKMGVVRIELTTSWLWDTRSTDWATLPSVLMQLVFHITKLNPRVLYFQCCFTICQNLTW